MRMLLSLAGLAGLVALTGCQSPSPEPPKAPPVAPKAAATTSPDVAAPTGLTGEIKIDGSSTVYPITEAVAEELGKSNPGLKVTVGISGTGGGFKKFIAGETDISDASRPIKDKEDAGCKEKGVEYIELPVAFDGLSVMVNPANTFVDKLTVAELKKIWEPESKVRTWKDVRSEWPAEPIKLFGPGTDSGTFDYFTEAICGKEDACRSDFTPSEDDNVLVTGIAGEKGALGFFGYAYYAENKDKLKLVPIAADDKSAAVAPSETTIQDGTYKPLSRPLFIYVNKKAVGRPEVAAFVKYYLQAATTLVKEAKYVALPAKAYELALKRFEAQTTGSVFLGQKTVGMKIEDILAKESASAAEPKGEPKK